MKKHMKNKNQLKNLRIVNFGVGKSPEGFGTIITRYIDGVGNRSITINTEIPFEELKVINTLLREYDMYVDMDNVLRNTKEFEIKN